VSDIFDQVEEELRQDQMRALWQRYGGYVIGAAVAIVAATFGNQMWLSYNADKNATASEQYALAADAAAAGDLSALDTVIDGTHSGYAALAGFAKADALLGAGNRAGAVELLDQISGKAGLPESIRDLAGLKAANLLMESGSVDDVAVRLAPLAQEGRPYFYAAKEASAVNAYRGDRADEARTIFAALAGDFAAPRDIRGRAAEMLQIMGPPAVADEEAAAEENPNTDVQTDGEAAAE